MSRYHYHNHKKKRRDPLGIVLCLLLLAIAALIVVYVVRSKNPKTPETTEPPALSEQTAAATGSELPPETPVSTEVQTAAPTTAAPTGEPIQPPSSEPAPAEPTPGAEDWKLLLVNADHPLPEGFTVTLKQLRNGQAVDERIYPELQQMFDDARKAGIYPLINESFRTAERQQEILDKYIAKYKAEGLSQEAAEAKALTVVAVPGTSEHQLGLALDIIAEYDSDNTATWNWLRDNSWRYGFILRYPADKEAVTGITYEAWHFRYVGVPTAQEITESGLCLEEYLAQP